MSQERVNSLTQFVRGVLSIVGVPIREFLQIVGHSLVASWALVGICGVFGVYIWSSTLERMHQPSIDALRAEREARAEWYRIKNEAEGSRTSSASWVLAAVNVTQEGLKIDVPKLPGATVLRGVWKLNGDSQAQGAFSVPFPPGAPDGEFVSFSLPSSSFSTWQLSGRYDLSLEQVLPEGKVARMSRSSYFQIPPQSTP